MAAVLVSVANQQENSFVLTLEESQAYQAAKAGAEWGIFRIRSAAPAAATCPAAVNNLGLVNGMTVTLRCQQVLDGNAEPNMGKIFKLTVTACNQPVSGLCPGAAVEASYVERQVVLLTETEDIAP
ncbi:MAG: hypothetical protein D3905_16745, partial [Candidatus Electrothrix sp. AS4_5]|nr:hypothetical protein [Candidatus Electrothrix gigas]